MEPAWLDFLSEDHARAVERDLALTRMIEAEQVSDPHIRFSAYVNLGRCYDLLGRRREALESCARAEQKIAGTPWEPMKDDILRDYADLDYSRVEWPRMRTPEELYDICRNQLDDITALLDAILNRLPCSRI